MVSLTRPKVGDRGLLTLKPSSSSRSASSSGNGRASGSGNKAGSQDGKIKGKDTVVKPWANQPWPLIEVPSRSQNISHPALYIANEISHIHNAMLRGLNSIYLQTPHVRQEQDIADLLFLTQSWSTWLLDHHHLKENTMLPSFEAALGVSAGTLTLPSPSATSRITYGDTTTRTVKGKEKDGYRKEEGGEERGEEEEETISFLLHRVYAYASATHKDPQAYNAATLQGLLSTLAETLVPHLTRQVGLLASMQEMCLGSFQAGGNTNTNTNTKEVERDEEIPGPLPIPMVKITKTISSSSGATATNKIAASSPPSTSPPTSPSSSTFSIPSAPTPASPTSSPPHSPPSVSLSLFPSTTTASTSRPLPHHAKTSSSSSITSASAKISNTNKNKTNSDGNAKHTPDGSGGSSPVARSMSVIDRDAKARLARARALLEADDRANKLTQIHAAAEAQAAASMDPFIIPPMIVRLRDITITTTSTASAISSPFSHSSSSSSSLSRVPSSSSLSSNSSRRGGGMGMGIGGNSTGGVGIGVGAGAGVGAGLGNKGEWPRMSVPAVHAVADKLSPRHAGAWRFLPCDVWGRPRELPFLGV
ncbi:hypothetical protein F5Y09DRAFT_252366 [Xylaria sp. FL1042]|nr:hypothetical protein F5Y09DRAFT_252366 [Xylaria sp. FL1042]